MKVTSVHEIQSLIAANNAVQPAVNSTVFDRGILRSQTMGDRHLAQEVLALFVGQLDRLADANWANLVLAFEMHTLNGSAAAVGAVEIAKLAADWKHLGPNRELIFARAFTRFKNDAITLQAA